MHGINEIIIKKLFYSIKREGEMKAGGDMSKVRKPNRVGS